jgi:hypothetical protein
LVLVDASLPDLDRLLAALPASARVSLVHENGDALAQMARAAEGLRGLQGLHLLGHGQPGRMCMGGQWLDAAALAQQPEALASLSAALADEAHVWLYGCHSGQGRAGQQWLDAWALTTGAAVHASEHAWGPSSPGAALQAHNPLHCAWQASGWGHTLVWLNQTPMQQADGFSLYPKTGEVQNWFSFVALKADGTVVTWGMPFAGGDSSAVQSQLTGVQQVFSSQGAYAALKNDGTVVTWGISSVGGNSREVQSQLTDVTQVFSSQQAFAALKADGTVVTWGSGDTGGDSAAVQDQLTGVTQVFSNSNAFAALKADGTVITWGSGDHGGDSAAVQDQLTGVTQIFCNYSAPHRDAQQSGAGLTRQDMVRHQ